jgi:hypothetical protein
MSLAIADLMTLLIGELYLILPYELGNIRLDDTFAWLVIFNI